MTGSDDRRGDHPLPLTADGVTAAWLSAALATGYPGVVINEVKPVQIIDGTATKVRLRLAYGPNSRHEGVPDQSWQWRTSQRGELSSRVRRGR